MNKKLIALAVAGAMAVPAASMAAVTVYGTVHISAQDYGSLNSGNTHKTLSMSSNVSNIGVKGMDQLGNGMTAFFNGDWFVDWVNHRTAGAGQAFKANDTKMGLKGGFGMVSIGRQAGPLKVLGRKTDLFGNTIGDTRSMTSSAVTDARLAKSIAYFTPNMSGMTGVIGYSAGTDAGGEGINPSVKSANAWTAGLLYSNGPIFAGFAYEHLTKQNIANMASGGLATADTSGKDWRIAGSYKMGAMKFVAHYAQSKGLFENPSAGNSGTKRMTWGVGASYSMGNNVLKVQYAAVGKCKGCATEANTKASLWALGVDHNMSKSVKLYAMYAKIKNDSNSAIYLGDHSGFGEAVTVTDGTDPGAVSVGMIYKF